MKTVFFTGSPGSGKSTLVRQLAARLGWESIDLDERIVAREGRTIPEIFASEGEAGFRAIESRVLRELLVDDSSAGNRLVALGGGTLLDPSNRTLVEAAGEVVCLETPSAEERARRLAAGGTSRPLGDRAEERAAHYASFPNRLAASFEVGGSLVVVGTNFARTLLSDARQIVADGTVARLYDFGCDVTAIPSGETHKTPQTIMALWQAFALSGLGRQDVVTAVGGGVTGDLVGFAAATWMRGIDWINVPTTLLAMVDASTGGKTGCDLPEGKNLAGAFHSPRLVLIDTVFLDTLSPELIAAGRAEMIKHALIDSRAPIPAGVGVPTAREIAENLMVKVRLVREDPFERTGRRILLNCGHTVAHAIEKLSNYKISHGAAVALGCVEEAREAVRRHLAPPTWPTELAATFAAAGLPTNLPAGFDWPTLVPLMRGDKKRAGASVTFALPCGWGDVRMLPIDLSAEAHTC